MIRRVRPIHDNFGSGSACDIDHPKGNLAHAAQAHLGKEIEVVFVDRDDARSIRGDRAGKALLGTFHHAVEQDDREATLPEEGGSVKRAEGWIWLHFPNLFPVMMKVVRVG